MQTANSKPVSDQCTGNVPGFGRYTSDGLKGLTTLKGRGGAVACILQELADQKQLDVYLATLCKHDNGWGESSSRKKNKMNEVHSTAYNINHWLCLDGSLPPFESLEVDENNFLQVQRTISACLQQNHEHARSHLGLRLHHGCATEIIRLQAV